ncbi:MAG: polysaccharide deacetylase family protein [Chitinophagaceae bacterium]|jgi:peptidoglycan/xylan/chitin deacetylase (PgdA/CDA1 family)|nr:polysaccharide deacetylase family protein [Chitinophagaceae bacterium]
MTHGYQHLKRLCLLLAGIVFLMGLKKADKLILPGKDHMTWYKGAIIRGDSTQKKMALVFTGDEFADGAHHILQKLKDLHIKASFFFTGRFYSNPSFKKIILQLKKEGHYLGAHSDQHLLYCDWIKRDSLLVSKSEFNTDLLANYKRMENFGIRKQDAIFYIPPYEWYNDTIAAWTKDFGLQLINNTPGTISHADYTTPADVNYRSSEKIFQSIINYEKNSTSGLNGFILLLHIGTDPKRTDKFYYNLEDLLIFLEKKDYQSVSIFELLK